MLMAEGLLEALPERMPKRPTTSSQRRDQNRAERMARYEECRGGRVLFDSQSWGVGSLSLGELLAPLLTEKLPNHRIITAPPAGAPHQESFHVRRREEPAAGVLPAFRAGRAAPSYTSKESDWYRGRLIDSVRTARSVVCAPL